MNINWLVLLFKEFLEVVPNGSTQLGSFWYNTHIMVLGSLNIDLFNHCYKLYLYNSLLNN